MLVAADAAAARPGDGALWRAGPRLCRGRGRGRRRRFGDRDDPLHEGDLPRRLHHRGRPAAGAAADRRRRRVARARRTAAARLRLVPPRRARRHLADLAAAPARAPRARADARWPRRSPPPRSGRWARSSGASSAGGSASSTCSTVRFAFGLVAAACALPIVGAPAFSSLHDSVWIAVLALVTGLLALGLYYYGLQRTPALLAVARRAGVPGHADAGRDLRLRRVAALDAVGGRRAHGDRDQPAAGAAPRARERCRPASRRSLT